MKPPVVILCGGRGRAESAPKALERFLLATGCLGEAVEEFAARERWINRGAGSWRVWGGAGAGAAR